MKKDPNIIQKKILILSSYSPYHSCNIIKDLIDGLKMCRCEVDFVGVENYTITENGFFTLNKIKNYRDESILKKIKHKLTNIKVINKSVNYFKFKILKKKINPHPVFLHLDDTKPDIKIEEWENVLPHKKYDLIISTFMRGHITSVTLKYLWEKYTAPIFICAVDMQPMTGGCFYFHDCEGYKHQCMSCFIMNNSTLPHANFMLKKEIYKKHPIYACGNSYMKKYFKLSGLWNDYNYLYLPTVINENIFSNRNKETSRKYFGLSNDAFVIFSGAQNIFEERKGMKYLFDAINIFKKSHKDVKVELALAGNSFGKRIYIQDVRVVMLGFLNTDEMVSMYSAADIFACASWNDAGPSMINQSIMCGTPVLAFNTGVAQDVVINGQTGYRAELKNTIDLSMGISQLYSEISRNSDIYAKNCREYGLQNFSRIEIGKKILDYLNKISITH